MRTFIALELPAGIRSELTRLQERLKNDNPSLSWVKPHNMHLTLKFLGEIDPTLLIPITAILKETVKDTPEFDMRLSALGAYPNLRYPRVLWMGLKQGGKEAQAIAGQLEHALEKLAIMREKKPFSSHITLARVRLPSHKENLLHAIQGLKEDSGDCNPQETYRASKVTLFKSTITPQGPLYEPLATANLIAT
jgi:RNA 2',3'-cyclic 3'-phosphodiesterase